MGAKMGRACRLALIGCGAVGSEVLRNLGAAGRKDAGWPEIEGAGQVEFTCVGIADSRSFACEEKLDPGGLLKQKSGAGCFENPAKRGEGGIRLLDKMSELGLQPDILIEATPTTDNSEPAFTHVKRAIEAGCNVVLANKGPVAVKSGAIRALVNQHGKAIRCEATVGGELPFLDVVTSTYRGKNVTIRGILNGTTNFILSQLCEGLTYEAAFAKAKKLGLTETDPGDDLLGIDYARKLIIISKLAGKPIGAGDVAVRGIAKQFGNDFGELTLAELLKTKKKKAGEGDYSLIGGLEAVKDELKTSKNGSAQKLIAELNLKLGKGFVKLEWIGEDDPLAKVGNEQNFVLIKNSLGRVLWESGPGRGAGGEATANAILRDCVKIANSNNARDMSMI